MRTALKGALLGLLLGLLAGTAEAAHLTWFVRGTGVRPDLWAYAWLIDGGLLAAAGLLLGALWALLSLPRRRARRREAHRYVYATRRAVPAGRTTRRGALRLAAAGVTTVGVLGLARWVEGGAPQLRAARLARVPSDTNAADGGQSQPNVLLITVDTLRADQLGAYGHPFVKTPSLDFFAKQGARFDLHLVQEPQTNPSHASMFTGMYPSSSGVRVHMVDKLPANLDTLATVFNRAGYATAGMFSWMSFDNEYCGFQRGFQIYQDLTLNKPTVLNNALMQQAAASYRVAEQYLAVPQAMSSAAGVTQRVENASKGRADRTTDAAIAQLKAFGGRPFFLWVHYFDPHYPYEPPAGYATLYDPSYRGAMNGSTDTVHAIMDGKLHPAGDDLKKLVSLYQGEISYLDSQLGRLFTALDTLALTPNTVVALSGDHGESFAEHADFVEDGNIFHPRSLYNAESRVPLLLRYPPRIRPGTTVAVPTQAIDVFPTLLDLAGVPVPQQVQGTSMAPVLDGVDDGTRRLAFSSMPDYTFTAIATPNWKLIRNNANGQNRLYDLRADPAETRDVLGANGETGAQLAQQLQAWMKAVKIS